MKIKIAEVRKARGIKQKDLCVAADISKKYLIDLEQGRQDNPTIKTLLRVAAALGVKVADIVDFEGA